MDLEILSTAMQWLFPCGFAGTAIGWLIDRRLHRARALKETHEAYKSMYDDLAKEVQDLARQIIKLRNDNIHLKGALSDLQEAVQLAFDCRHFRSCPILARMPQLKRNDRNTPTDRLDDEDPRPDDLRSGHPPAGNGTMEDYTPRRGECQPGADRLDADGTACTC